MSDWLPCAYALLLLGAGMALAGSVGYRLGRWREELALLEMLRPEK